MIQPPQIRVSRGMKQKRAGPQHSLQAANTIVSMTRNVVNTKDAIMTRFARFTNFSILPLTEALFETIILFASAR